MTSFSLIQDHEQPEIAVSASHGLFDIDPMIYGGFVEHMGRCIYGGLYDPDNEHGLIDENGFRLDVIEAVKELQVPVMRWPGGNFVASYHWQDGIGPREQRPKRPELAWQGQETNQFGTDEFMKWCRIVRTEPYLALNFGTGTLDEALAWVEYCNSSADTHYANLRRKNGHAEPYRVKYWALGNEVWGPWQVEQMTKEDYAKKAKQWAKALKLLDPSIVLVLCGKDGYSDWDRYVLQECIEIADMHSIHLYTADKAHLPNVSSPLAAERAIQITASLIDLARIEANYSVWPAPVVQAPRTKKRPTICFDEWNVWDPIRAPGNLGAEELYDVSDALAVGVWLNVFVRQSQYLGMCNIAQSINVISPLMTTERGIIKQTTYWPLLLFSKYMQGKTLAVNVRCGEWKGDGTNPEWIRSTMRTPWLDVSATIDSKGWINLVVINISETQDWCTKITGTSDTQTEVYVIGEDRDIRESNMKGGEVGIVQRSWSGRGDYIFPKHSLTLLRWQA